VSTAVDGPLGIGCSSPQIGELAKALAAAQGEMSRVFKDAQNPHFRSNYATLASALNAARPALSKHGIAIIQSSELLPEAMLEVSTVLACGDQWVRTSVTIPVTKRDAQAIGSAISYGRRYGLLAACGLAPEDDDGNAASTPVATRTPPGQRVRQ